MAKVFRTERIEHFKDTLWAQSPAGERLSCVTPLYAERYRGIRNSGQPTAHDYWEFTGVVSGSGSFYADEKYPLEADSAILVPPGIAHYEHAEHELDTIWLGFRAELPGIDRNHALQLHSDQLVERLVRFWNFSSRNFSMTGAELDGMLLTIIGLFFRKLHERKRQFHSMAQQAAQFLNEHFHENISIAELAQNLQCSEGHLFRKFKEFTGETPVGYLNTIRIKQAAFYLKNTNFQINHIAELCGFSDPYYFSRTFHKLTGQSPKQYRDTP